jgi:hypothetical protein
MTEKAMAGSFYETGGAPFGAAAILNAHCGGRFRRCPGPGRRAPGGALTSQAGMPIIAATGRDGPQAVSRHEK